MNRTLKTVLTIIFVAGAAIRFVDAFRPIDRSSWREADVAGIARNFATESMNILFPRIDWRGTTPGFAEMEFPLYPWAIAVTYRIFGINEIWGRLWALAFGLATMFLFLRLAREYLDGIPLALGFAFFALNPLTTQFATSIQPEGLLMMFYVGAALFFVRWIRTGSDRDFWPAAILTSLALLAKLTAAHFGLLFVFLLFRAAGIGAVRNRRVWIFGVLALVPAALWYMHAKGFWKQYGNSLGVSNEYHWIGPDFFTNPYFAKGILTSELIWVWSLTGIVIGAVALIRGFRERVTVDAAVWLAACFIFYIATARTSADDWAAYYHIFSVVPASLLFGSGVRESIRLVRDFADRFSQRGGMGNLAHVVLLVGLAGIALLTFLIDAKLIRARVLEDRVVDPSFVCAREIKPLLTEPGLILTSGDRCFDTDGYEVAYNASFMFYWLERKGFNVCVEEQSVEKVRSIAADGAKYFVALRYYMNKKPGFETAMRREFKVIYECDEVVVFDLRR